ncbi:MAG TPA: hypothetical protein VHM25_18125 [Polyangiaceae bacterium]|nr:hypothetical protein [Polyangiaceae bacterium]
MACAAAFALLPVVNNCSFPDYGFPQIVAGSSNGGAGGMPFAGAGSGGTANGGSAGAGSGGRVIDGGGAAGTTGGSVGEGGDGGAAGSGDEPCVFPVPVNYPQHCFNKTAGDGESGVDCGGNECAPCSSNQACTQASDCLSQRCASNKTCVPVINLTYTPIDISAITPAPKFTLNFTYLDTPVMSLSDLTIRYYYSHKNVTEPVAGLHSQATIDPGNAQVDISAAMLTSVHRFPLGPVDGKGLTTDSYLEIAFSDTRTVTPGTKFVITQELGAGNTSSPLFDQNSHYSFSTATSANTALTLYRGEQRIWGVEPPMALFPECAFAGGVNVNGPALVVGGEALQPETDAEFDLNGAASYVNGSELLPTADEATTTLLGTGRTLNTGESITWSVPNGKYWAYAWLTSIGTTAGGTLSLGGKAADKFINTASGGTRWGLIGPYAVDVTAKSLQLTVNGSVNIGGLKLYEAAR